MLTFALIGQPYEKQNKGDNKQKISIDAKAFRI